LSIAELQGAPDGEGEEGWVLCDPCIEFLIRLRKGSAPLAHVKDQEDQLAANPYLPEDIPTPTTRCEYCYFDYEQDELALISDALDFGPEHLVCRSCCAAWVKEYREGFQKWEAEVAAEYEPNQPRVVEEIATAK